MRAAVRTVGPSRVRPERGVARIDAEGAGSLAEQRLALAAALTGATATAALLTGSWLLAVRNGIGDIGSFWSQNSAPDLIVPMGLTAVGAVVVARRSRNVIGWLFLASGVIVAIRSLAENYAVTGLHAPGTLPGVDWAAWLANWLIGLIFPTGIFLFLVLLFPNGHLLSRRWRPLAWAALTLTALATLVYIFDPTQSRITPDLPALPNPIGIKGMPLTTDSVGWIWPLGMLLLLTAAASPFIRYRRADGEEREQLKWFAFAVVITMAAIAVSFVLTLPLPSPVNNIPFNAAIIGGIGVAIPVACGVAILKYRLYGIDLVISRTLVYGSLAVLITGIYVGIAVGIGELVGSGGRPNLGLSILATAIVAVGFQPARVRLQRVANRLVYGRRVSPYQVLSEFSSQVAVSLAADEVLPRMARLLLAGTAAESATVWLSAGGALRPAAWWPRDAAQPTVDAVSGSEPQAVGSGMALHIPGATRAVEVRLQGELLGALSVTKHRNDELTPVEEKLLDDLGHQAGLVLKNVRLTADLQHRLEELRASRQRLVSAQDAERRRLERNLHDGAQQHLVALKVKLGLAQMLAAKDPEKANATLEQLKADTDEALQTLRDLARGIYPPLLAEKGLPAALEAHARRATVAVTVEADGVGRYPQEIEATVYFCVLEALQNVQKYANATEVTLRLRETDGMLRFEVRDNGDGFDVANVKKGSGLINMADRLDSIEGTLQVTSAPREGSVVAGAIPVPAPVEVAS
ncbi:MAG: sensor histidine kinase [Candidatus Dormibacteraeota bacterium]|nr:sensor histidine kinase [Candidatus Dormibacteraeota bacterium]